MEENIPMVQAEITGGEAVITGYFTKEEAEKFAKDLNPKLQQIPHQIPHRIMHPVNMLIFNYHSHKIIFYIRNV